MSKNYVVHSHGTYIADHRGATAISDIKKAHKFTKDDAHKMADKLFKHEVLKINEEVPTNNISDGAVANPENRPLGVGAKTKHTRKNNKTLSLFKRWKDSVDNV